MIPTAATNPERDKKHRFSPEMISHAIQPYFRFSLSTCDVEGVFCGPSH
jgi:hypothetical protein